MTSGHPGPTRPDRYALLEMRALLDRIVAVSDDGGRDRYVVDERHRWVLHRLWIAVGNEAVAYAAATDADPYRDEPWNTLRRLRNHLAHRRLPDIDDDFVWGTTQLRPEPLARQLEALLRRGGVKFPPAIPGQLFSGWSSSPDDRGRDRLRWL